MSETSKSEEDLITPAEIKDALGSSGYLLEGRVAQVLQDLAGHVELNRFIADPRDEGRSIEIDVWGQLPERLGDDCDSVVAAETFIECKNNSQPVVFFMKSLANRWANVEYIKLSGFPISSADPDTRLHVRLQDLLEMTFHHYCDVSGVATQFCSFTRDQGEEKQKQHDRKALLTRHDWCWKTESMEHYSKSFASLCVAAETDESEFVILDQQNIQLRVTYPIIVFQGTFYEAHTTGGANRPTVFTRSQKPSRIRCLYFSCARIPRGSPQSGHTGSLENRPTRKAQFRVPTPSRQATAPAPCVNR